MEGRNFDVVLRLVQYAIEQRIDISFIEEMHLGDVGHSRGESFCSSDEVRGLIANRHQLLDSAENSGGPARYVRLERHPGTRIGFILPNSHNFYGSCNRGRMTVEGKLLLCLGQDDALDLRGLLRRYPLDDKPLIDAVQKALRGKPLRHHSNPAGEVQIVRFMNMSGG